MTYVHCARCPNRASEFVGTKIRKQEAFRQAKAEGYVLLDGQHLCPECASKCTQFEKLSFKYNVKGKNL
jgi:glutaredoxin-related protein